MVTFEAVRAKYGDSILLHFGPDNDPQLVVIDGGPPGVWNDALQPRLDQLREERGLADAEPLDIALLMVSHLDADHISGVLDLMRLLNQKRVDQEPPPYNVRKAWVNTFEDLTGQTTGGASFGAADAAALAASALGGALAKTQIGHRARQRRAGPRASGPDQRDDAQGKHALQGSGHCRQCE